MRNPYDILGLSKGSDETLLRERYAELKAKYSEDRFLSGEEGNQGAKNLSELEEAWFIVEKDLAGQKAKIEFGGDYGQIDDLIKQGKFDEAQSMLDGISTREAEWHYLQSIIFYKREWMTECRKQLLMALEKEPRNKKYKEALDKLDMVMGSSATNPRELHPEGGQVPPQPEQNMNTAANCLSNCCCAYCLTDCCCNMTRCCG